jgi:hypothetical protein
MSAFYFLSETRVKYVQSNLMWKEKGDMKKFPLFLSLLILSSLVLSACQPGAVTPTPAGGQDVITGHEATVESLEIMILESFPVQVHVVVSGYLADGCVSLADISAEREEQTFTLTLTTTRPAGEVECTEALVPFEESVALDVYGLDAGEYQVVAQEQTASFTLDVDNVPQSPETGMVEGSEAMVETLDVNVLESMPVQVTATVGGNLPDGCVGIVEIRSSQEGETFSIEVITQRPAGDVACTEALVPFEETVALDVAGLSAGEYMVKAGELTETFTLETDNSISDETAACAEPQAGQVKVEVVDRELGLGFCLLAPEGFSLEDGEEPHSWVLNGPVIPAAGGSITVYGNLAIRVYPLEGTTFMAFVQSQMNLLDIPWTVSQLAGELGQQETVILQAPLGDFTSRIIWAEYGDHVFQLISSPFEPSLLPEITAEMEALYQAVMVTWVFLGT